MRGDLHTLKKVCMYASNVMLVGEIILAAVGIATICIAIASSFSDTAEDLLLEWISMSASDPSVEKVAATIKFLMVWVMGFMTVKAIHDIMCSIRDEHSPFTEDNTNRMIWISLMYLSAAFIILILDLIIGTKFAYIAFVFFGCILISVVMYCLALVCRYGGVLQKESDETL